MSKAKEVNFDGLVGPTHHYAGLSYGNIASMKHRSYHSSPKKAALQGLKKMKLLIDLKIPQAVFPPQERPSMKLLKNLGFKGTEKEMLKNAHTVPFLLESLSSSSAMWAANCATVCPSIDSVDGKVHLSIANLLNRFHRSIEVDETNRLCNFLFSDPHHFVVHPPLLKGGSFGDEGAANHTRFSKEENAKGVHLFVYGKSAFEEGSYFYPARQALEASQAIARRHGLKENQTVFAKQNPELINKGVFHNDVISTGHRLIFLYHEQAFYETQKVISELEEKIALLCHSPLKALKVTEDMLPLTKAIESYFFNSQIVTLPDGKDVMIAPEECRNLDLSWIPFPIHFIEVRESMQNGGGPACLRLRLELTNEEISKVHPNVFLTDKLYDHLILWVENHYRDELSPKDLSDPLLLQENWEALDELTQILHLGSFYSFQKEGV